MKQNILLSALLAALLVLAGCGGGGGSSPTEMKTGEDSNSQTTGMTAEQLAMAVMELESELSKVEATATPTDDQIAAIEKEHMELQEAIKDVADGVDTKDAQKILDGYMRRLETIKNKQTASTSMGDNPSFASGPLLKNQVIDFIQ